MFPSQWKCASVIPVHKTDSMSNPSMYRPIFLSNISKVMEAAEHNQLQTCLLQHHLISDRQFGFKPIIVRLISKPSYLTNGPMLWEEATKCGLLPWLSKVLSIRYGTMVFAPSSKAKGVTVKLLTWVESYSSNRSIKVVLSGQSSSPITINASVPQSSILGPLMFFEFMVTLEMNECENTLCMYADESTLFCEIRSSNDKCLTASLNRGMERGGGGGIGHASTNPCLSQERGIHQGQTYSSETSNLFFAHLPSGSLFIK